MKRKSLKQQQGVVIVIALFVVALVAAMAYIMMARMSRDTERTQLILRDAEAMQYVSGSVSWAKDVLINNWKNQKKDQRIDNTPVLMPQSVENEFVLSAILYDAQGRFNLNAVQHPPQMQVFEYLILTVLPKLKKDQAQEMVASLNDWITPGRRDGGVNQYYLELPLPYRAGHGPMVMPSELRMVRGFTQSAYQALKPYVIALPATVELNIQTADIPVIMTLNKAITPALAKEIVAIRQKKPFLTPEQFTSLPVLKNHGVDMGDVKLTTTSQYFLLETKVSIEMQRWVIYTLLKREAKDKKASVTVVWQTRGDY